MKHLLIVMLAIILCADIFVPLGATKSPNIDEIEMMLKKVESNLSVAAGVTSAANKAGEQMLSEKVAEKQALKEEVSASKEKISAMTSTMLFMGVDTSLVGMDTTTIANMMRLNGIK
jgi:hypothetical protein